MKRAFLFVVLTLALSACQTTVPPVKDAQYFFSEAERLLEKELYEQAIENYEKVRESFYSAELSSLAEMKIADAHYQAKHYVEAAAAYEDFLNQHPQHPKVPHITYKLGMAYYKQILSADRDQTATHNALGVFETLQARWPERFSSEQLAPLVLHCRQTLGDHETYVGNFYLRTKEYAAAVKRLEGALKNFPEAQEQDRLLFLLGNAYLRNGDRSKAENAFNRLKNSFPQSKHIKEANKLLEETI